MRTITICVADVTYGNVQDNIRRFVHEGVNAFDLIREPDNPYDGNAVRVETEGRKLGYVPKETAKDLAPEMDNGRDFVAVFVRKNESLHHDTVGLTIKIVERV